MMELIVIMMCQDIGRYGPKCWPEHREYGYFQSAEACQMRLEKEFPREYDRTPHEGVWHFCAKKTVPTWQPVK